MLVELGLPTIKSHVRRIVRDNAPAGRRVCAQKMGWGGALIRPPSANAKIVTFLSNFVSG